jgi:hypothetical protein
VYPSTNLLPVVGYKVFNILAVDDTIADMILFGIIFKVNKTVDIIGFAINVSKNTDGWSGRETGTDISSRTPFT